MNLKNKSIVITAIATVFSIAAVSVTADTSVTSSAGVGFVGETPTYPIAQINGNTVAIPTHDTTVSVQFETNDGFYGSDLNNNNPEFEIPSDAYNVIIIAAPQN